MAMKHPHSMQKGNFSYCYHLLKYFHYNIIHTLSCKVLLMYLIFFLCTLSTIYYGDDTSVSAVYFLFSSYTTKIKHIYAK